MLSSFSFGYITIQIVIGILAKHFWGKLISGGCIFVCSFLEFVIHIVIGVLLEDLSDPEFLLLFLENLKSLYRAWNTMF